ncbi:NAD(P)H-dependent oxidoreductase [Actinomadura sp. ATCC 31491]|uniref:NAD(P)H-dependent oxidoreductase n=1 Tax=Actinomadura luzonensis TaxID=2805427 RepID=A0ABT0FTQ2_9ACTN|nr:NAD(P)H-dependent oxidoreductase [Actinomadura luzonensis]MCK2215278.1 NAD(P)H-dependent oxidoreductase [Actinomadura luzonensis]
MLPAQLVDLDPPLLDEVMPAFDAYVFVTPEYNHSTSGALKNALDFLYAEWNNKSAGFVSYGVNGGTRAVEHLRLMMGELQIADVRAQVTLRLLTDFRPAAQQENAVDTMLDQVIAWGLALRPLRGPALGRG